MFTNLKDFLEQSHAYGAGHKEDEKAQDKSIIRLVTEWDTKKLTEVHYDLFGEAPSTTNLEDVKKIVIDKLIKMRRSGNTDIKKYFQTYFNITENNNDDEFNDIENTMELIALDMDAEITDISYDGHYLNVSITLPEDSELNTYELIFNKYKEYLKKYDLESKYNYDVLGEHPDWTLELMKIQGEPEKTNENIQNDIENALIKNNIDYSILDSNLKYINVDIQLDADNKSFFKFKEPKIAEKRFEKMFTAYEWINKVNLELLGEYPNYTLSFEL